MDILQRFTPFHIFLDCPSGLHGLYCEYQCHCADSGEKCNAKTGSCSSGCAAGWSGDDCNTPDDTQFAGAAAGWWMWIEFVNILPLHLKIKTDYIFYDVVVLLIYTVFFVFFTDTNLTFVVKKPTLYINERAIIALSISCHDFI